MKSKIGWVISVLIAILLLFSAFGKFKGGPEVAEGMAKMGLPENILLGLGILEATVVALYLIPITSFFGVILLTGYMGGAILTHLRIGDVVVVQVLVAVLAWVGYGLRNYDDVMRLIRGRKGGQ